MLNLLKHPASYDYHEHITTVLNDLGITASEVSKDFFLYFTAWYELCAIFFLLLFHHPILDWFVIIGKQVNAIQGSNQEEGAPGQVIGGSFRVAEQEAPGRS